jgi:hypothetical protein
MVVDFAAKNALHDMCQGFLDGFWIVQRHGFEPALAGALGNSFGVALVFAVMKSAEAQSAAGGALAEGAVFAPVLAFGCVGDGHLLVGFSPCLLPYLCANYSRSVASRVFGRNYERIKDLGLGRIKLYLFRAQAS